MIEKYVKGRVSVFVDASNILYSQQTLKWKVDYKKLIDYFKKYTKLVSVHFYSGKVSKNRKQEKFFKKMQSFGYKVVTKEVKWIRDKNGKIFRGHISRELIATAHKYIPFEKLKDELMRRGK